jgi:diacylglycerol kinase (ATP)
MPEADRIPNPQAPPPAEPAWRHERKSVVRSFRYAWDGVLFVFLTQRHMRAHAVIITLVLLGAWGLGVTDAQLLHLLAAMAMVLIAEMFNTTIEMTVDMIVDSYNPQAKIIKDIAAGAVLMASLYAASVATVVFFLNPRLREAFAHFPNPPPQLQRDVIPLVLIGALLEGILIAYVKYRTKRGKFWRGGLISGHTALGFLLATSIWILTHNLSVTALALALAILVSQSRVQARIHSPIEVVLGALMGILVAFVLFVPWYLVH